MKSVLSVMFTVVAATVTAGAEMLEELSENKEFTASVGNILPELAQACAAAGLPACVKTVQEGFAAMATPVKIIGMAWKDGEKRASAMMSMAFGDEKDAA